MKTIGLAGRAGSGKSAVARLLAERDGVEWIDLDRVAWDAYEPGTEAFYRIVERFGEDVIGEDGEIDRGELAVRVFLDPEAKAVLEAIVHPEVAARLSFLIDDHRDLGTEVLLVEGALLTSSPHVDRSVFDAVIWFDASDEERERRLAAEGRAEHAPRGAEVTPGEGAVLVDAEDGIEQVAARVWEQIQALPSA